MMSFDFYLKKGIVKKKTPDKNLAKNLIRDAQEKYDVAERVKEFSPKVAFELYYDAIRCLLEAGLALYGYKTWSHEAAISFARYLDLNDNEIALLDDIRKLRNESKYYGKDISKELLSNLYSEIITLYQKLLNKLDILLSKQ